MQGKCTVPAKLGKELATNPFLRPQDPDIRKTLGMCPCVFRPNHVDPILFMGNRKPNISSSDIVLRAC